MEKSSESYILDTSALISLESINILDEVIRSFHITITNSVIIELQAFAKYNDQYGKIAKNILKNKSKFTIEDCTITDSIEYVEETDNELYNLSLKKKLPLVTDETKLVHHSRHKIEVFFSPVFIVLLMQSGHFTKQEALDKLGKLSEIRNWGNNIIYLIMKNQIESS